MSGSEIMDTEAECGRFYLMGEIDEETRAKFIPSLRARVAALEEDDFIEIFIDCFGGDGFAMFDIVAIMEKAKRQGNVVKTVVPSYAASAGSFIAVAGSKGYRYIGENGEHFVHHGTVSPFPVKNPVELDRETERWQRWFDTTVSHYKKYCRIPALTAKLKDDNLWIDADTAIKWKLADKKLDEW